MEQLKWNGKTNLKLNWCIAFIVIFIATFITFKIVKDLFIMEKYATVGYLASIDDEINTEHLNNILSGTNEVSFVNKGKEYLDKNGYFNIADDIFVEQINNLLIIWVLFIVVVFIAIYMYINLIQRKVNGFISKFTYWLDNYDPQSPELLKNTFKNREITYLIDILNKKTTHIMQSLNNLRKDNLKASSYVDDVLHQLKTPLATLQLIIERIYVKEDNKKKSVKLKDACMQIDKMSLMIKDILRLSRLKSGRVIFQLKTHDFCNSIENVVNAIRPYADNKNVKIICNQEVHMDFEYDELWIKECIINILKNCIEYSDENSSIEITYKKTNHHYSITIKDEGSGIEEDEKELIFTRFYTKDHTHSFDNTGIGLSLAKEIILQHHGKLWVENNEVKGVTFTIVLPILSGVEVYNSYKSPNVTFL